MYGIAKKKYLGEIVSDLCGVCIKISGKHPEGLAKCLGTTSLITYALMFWILAQITKNACGLFVVNF